jgi:hypothetical protein
MGSFFYLHKLICILSYSLHEAKLFNKCLVIFYVFAGMGVVSSTHVEMHYVPAFLVGVWSTRVKIHFLSKLAKDAFGQPKLR